MADRATRVIHPADVRMERSSRRMIVRLSGEIDLSNAGAIRRSVADSISNQMVEVVVELTEVRYLDSAGISMLFDLSRRLAEHGQRFVVISPSASLIRRSLQASGWPSKFPLAESLHEAAEDSALEFPPGRGHGEEHDRAVGE